MTDLDVKWLKQLSKQPPDYIGLSDALAVLTMLHRGDLRHINDMEFRKECAEAHRETVGHD